jgi:hypothetical protein
MRRLPRAPLLVFIAVAACGFPQLSYEGADGGPSSVDGRATGDGPAGSEAGDTDAASDGTATGDGMTTQDSTASDSTAPIDSPSEAPVDAPHDVAAEGPPECDKDNDGYLAQGSPCMGTDCCDTDPNAHPGQTQFFTTADSCGSFNYHCGASVITEYLTNITCSGNGVVGCAGGPGFTGNPACGTSAPFSYCMSPGGLAACVPTSSMMGAQGCR